MLSWISEVISQFVSGDDEKQDDDYDLSLHDDDLDLLIFEDKTTLRREWSDGVVTRIDQEYFLIDDRYYWPKSLPLGRQHLESFDFASIEIGTKVRFLKKKVSEQKEWIVEEVRRESDCNDEHWDEKENCLPSWCYTSDTADQRPRLKDHASQCQLAEITLLKRPFVVLKLLGSTKETFEVNWREMGYTYPPWKGDLLSVNLEYCKGGSVEVKSVAPLRCTEGFGEITKWTRGHDVGTVDSNVFFSIDVCAASYNPQMSDYVKYDAVECQPGRFNESCIWRAIRVSPAPARLRNKQGFMPVRGEDEQYNLLCSKCGVRISILNTSLELDQLSLGDSVEILFEVTNDSDECQELESVKTLGNKRTKSGGNQTTFIDFVPQRLEAHTSTLLVAKSHMLLIGEGSEIVVFHFKDFKIGCKLDFKVSDPSLNLISAKGSWQDRQKLNGCSNSYQTRIVPGQKKKSNSTRVFHDRMNKLPEHEIPSRMWKAIIEKDWDLLLKMYPSLEEPLFFRNYVTKFSALLHLEEIATILRMQQYKMKGVVFIAKGSYLSLDVPGLSEKRPSLMLGDSVIASPTMACVPNVGSTGTRYQGVIHEVRSSSVLLMFEPTFQSTYCGELYDIEFKLNRNVFKKLHEAVREGERYLGEGLLFPESIHLKKPQVDLRSHGTMKSSDQRFQLTSYPVEGRKIPSEKSASIQENSVQFSEEDSFISMTLPLVLPLTQYPDFCKVSTRVQKMANYPFQYNGVDIPYYVRKPRKQSLRWNNKRLNKEQKLAVKRIILGEARPLPYIIFGPPGTGKTVTLVETILQIYRLRSDSRILVVAPSNSSADLLLQRLVNGGLKNGQIARLNAFQRAPESIPEELKSFCYVNDEIDVLRTVVKHRVLVATCTTAGGLYKLNFKRGHFTHCFLDEAGHTTEPEAMVPLGLLADGENAQVILAGDPEQLGPVLQSSRAKQYGLGQSFLERLCKSHLYKRDDVAFSNQGGYDPLLITKLVKNYRSHSSIIQVPSKLFYHSELETCAKKRIRNRFLKLQLLANPKEPLLFHGVRGQNFQEEDSPSWFNPVEAFQATIYVRDLYEYGVDPNEIGVIAPYRKQAEKIKILMNSFGLSPVKIGSVEEFQGQERPVIILSTVRSLVNRDVIQADIRHDLGFMHCSKRMNVAITRAQSLLIVIGDPHILVNDPNWLEFLRFSVKRKCYLGCDLPLGI